MDQYVSTPSSSDVDLRVEVSNSIDETNVGTRKLTLTSPVKSETSEMNNKIDKQITDLENLIKKLKDEITVMSQNANKEYMPMITEETPKVRRDLSNETIIIDNECDNIEETKNIRDTMKRKDNTECFEPAQYNHVYPLMIRNIILSLPSDGGYDTLGHAKTDIINKSTDEEIPEKISFIRQDINDIWDDSPEFKPEEDLEDMIEELQSEISEKMETIMDVNILESSDKFEDA